MVKVILGEKGSGNTKALVSCIHDSVQKEKGSLVCIEKGTDLRYDVDYCVRLIDIGDYDACGYTFLRGFISGLHGGNFDISHIFIDSLYKVSGEKDAHQAEEFLIWCERFGERCGVKFTITVTDSENTAPYGVKKFAQ